MTKANWRKGTGKNENKEAEKELILYEEGKEEVIASKKKNKEMRGTR